MSLQSVRRLRIALTVLGCVCLGAGLGVVLPWALVTGDTAAWLTLVVAGLLAVSNACTVVSLVSVERRSGSR